MQNMGNIITKHNELLFQSFEQPTQMCNLETKQAAQWAETASNSVIYIRQWKFEKVLPWDI